jgi:peptidoglycan/LPS O-acetylase OafA/YrhL
MSTQQQQQRRLLEIDGLRGISAAAVVTYHYTHRFDELYGHSFAVPDWLKYGGAGVTLFFMISGFVIYWSITSCKYPLDFVWSRFSRLYPTYWLAVCLTYGAVYCVGLPGREVGQFQFLANLSMLQGFLGISNVDGVYWTLCLELALYFWILIIFSLGQLRKVEYWLLPWMLVAHAWNGSSSWPAPVVIIQNLFMLKHVAVFAIGILFYKMYAKQAYWATYLTLGVALTLVNIDASLTDALITDGLALLFWAGISGRAGWLTFRPLLRLGAISYPLYLIHQNFGYMIMRGGYSAGLPPVVSICVALGVSLVLADLMHRFIEMPSRDYLVARYKASLRCGRWAAAMTWRSKVKL